MCSRVALVVLIGGLVLPWTAFGQGTGVSPDGQKGRIHTVVEGDTLWDITATYLGTPWIWPAIWKENTSIANPHLIYPGDLIWITDGEMRKLTPEEAEAFLSGITPSDGGPPAAAEDAHAPLAEPKAKFDDPFAVLDADDEVGQRIFRYRGLSHAPFVSANELEAAGAVLGSHAEYFWLSQEQTMIVSLGEGSVHVGDMFSVYRIRRRVTHPNSQRLIGYFIEVVGQAEISEVFPETSTAKILMAYAEIEPGDRLGPFLPDPIEFTLEPATGDIDGVIVAQQPRRLYSGAGDLVVLDKGASDGLVNGNELVIYRTGKLVRDPLSTGRLLEPDDIVGRLFVLKTAPESSVALVTRSHSEIADGDRVRTP